jgi:hypothetical protein
MNDNPTPPPKLHIAIEIGPDLSGTVVQLAHDYGETPQATVTRLIMAGIATTNALLAAYDVLKLLGRDENGDENDNEDDGNGNGR